MEIKSLEHLLTKVAHKDGCLVWMGFITRKGYGHAKYLGVNQPVHRLHWKFVRGEIPEGHHLHHTCPNKACVKLSHLEPILASEHSVLHRETSIEKARKMALDLKRNRPTCRNGHPWTPENTEYMKIGRRCITCRRKARMDKYWRYKAVGKRG